MSRTGQKGPCVPGTLRAYGAWRWGVPLQDPLNARHGGEFAHRVLDPPPLEARDHKNGRVKTTRASKWKTISAIFLLARTISGRFVRFSALKPCEACLQKGV